MQWRFASSVCSQHHAMQHTSGSGSKKMQHCTLATNLSLSERLHNSNAARHHSNSAAQQQHGGIAAIHHSTGQHSAAQRSAAQHSAAQPTLRKPYSVSATKAMGAVEMNTPAMGMKLQIKTNKPSRPIPGIFSIHMPSTVKAVLAIAICACSARLNTGGGCKPANRSTVVQ